MPEPSHPCPPIVESTLVHPEAHADQDGDDLAPSQAKSFAGERLLRNDDASAERRYKLFAVFFTGQQPGSRRQKMTHAYRLIDDATDPDEHARLRTMLRRCQSLLDATTESSA